jgi:hypothetical protein
MVNLIGFKHHEGGNTPEIFREGEGDLCMWGAFYCRLYQGIHRNGDLLAVSPCLFRSGEGARHGRPRGEIQGKTRARHQEREIATAAKTRFLYQGGFLFANLRVKGGP